MVYDVPTYLTITVIKGSMLDVSTYVRILPIVKAWNSIKIYWLFVDFKLKK